MKARIKKTGECVEVYHEPQHGQITNIYKESVLVNARMWEEDELEFNRPVTERIKTLADAMEALGQGNNLVEEYIAVRDKLRTDAGDLIAYLKLRIIVAALNEGWEPKFTEDEDRYFPWFFLYTKEQYNELDDERKGRCVLRSGFNSLSNYGFVLCYASNDASYSFTSFGSRLAFRTRELAAYAGRQFANEWADLIFK